MCVFGWIVPLWSVVWQQQCDVKVGVTATNSTSPSRRVLGGSEKTLFRTHRCASTHSAAVRWNQRNRFALCYFSLCSLNDTGRGEKKKLVTPLQVIVTLRQKILFHVRRRLDNHILFGFQSFFGSAARTKVKFGEQRFSFHHLSRAAKSHITRN